MNDTKKETGYDLQILLEIFDIHSIKPREAGSFKDDAGEKIDYGHAVKFKSIKVEEVPDEDWGTKEIEHVLEIEIPCDSMSETVALNNHLKAMKKSKKSFKVDITIPRNQGANFTAKTLLKGTDFKNAHKL